MPKQAENFSCKFCDFISSKKSNYDNHLTTAKHKYRTFRTENSQKMPLHICNCGKTYKARNSLWYHKKKCKEGDPESKMPEDSIKSIVDNENKIDVNVVRQLISQNRELQTELMNVVKNKSNIIINNTQNNEVNINMFLNEQCKNALNFADFINGIEISKNDLENNAQLGFVDGVSKILTDNLKQLTLHERPIHCTNLKREIMYIKDDNEWQKENTVAKLSQAINSISRKSISSLLEWKQNNPEYENIDSDFSNKCITIQQHSIAGNKQEVFYPKVIHNLAKTNTI
jgi:hypothetical protein